MDYLTILTTPTVAGRPREYSSSSNWYYHGTCLTKERFIVLLSPPEFLWLEAWSPGDVEADGVFLDGDLLCDECGGSMRGPPRC